jgi:two-component system phosphate regulon sensor histidine kinase PhoR
VKAFFWGLGFLVLLLIAGLKIHPSTPPIEVHGLWLLIGSWITWTAVWIWLRFYPTKTNLKEEARSVDPSGPPSETPFLQKSLNSNPIEPMAGQLPSNEEFLKLVLNSMNDGVLVLNDLGRVIWMNPVAEKILQLSKEQSLGKHYLELIRHAGLADLLTTAKKDLILKKEEIELEGKETKTFLVTAVEIQSMPKTVVGQLVVFSDITPMKKLLKMRSEFISNVSHELKTPLTAILGYAETLIDTRDMDPKKQVQFFQKIQRQAKSLQDLITDVLELSRTETGFIGLMESVDVLPVVHHALEILKTKMDAVQIGAEVKGGLGKKVWASREGLLKILVNLVDNAVKYSLPNTHIQIVIQTQRKDQEWVEISVVDQGIGIPLEFQERIFERFFRVEASRQKEIPGTGLGLAIVKHLLLKMNGEINLISKENKGSTFTIRLPHG